MSAVSTIAADLRKGVTPIAAANPKTVVGNQAGDILAVLNELDLTAARADELEKKVASLEKKIADAGIE